jgi:hypothetical protein
MLRRLILTITLAFLFGLGQQGALVHQFSHLEELAPLSQQQDKGAHSVCDECIAYGGIAYAIHTAQFEFPLPPALFEKSSHQAAASLSSAVAPYLARAPPLFV